MQIFRVHVADNNGNYNGWYLGSCKDDVIVIKDEIPYQTTHYIRDSIPEKYKRNCYGQLNYYDMIERHISSRNVKKRLAFWKQLFLMAGGSIIYE